MRKNQDSSLEKEAAGWSTLGKVVLRRSQCSRRSRDDLTKVFESQIEAIAFALRTRETRPRFRRLG